MRALSLTSVADFIAFKGHHFIFDSHELVLGLRLEPLQRLITLKSKASAVERWLATFKVQFGEVSLLFSGLQSLLNFKVFYLPL